MIHSAEKSKNASKSLSTSIKYVLREKDAKGNIRDDIQLLRGDPDLLLEMNKSLGHRKGKTFLHTSLAFTEKETEMLSKDPAKLNRILLSYQKQLAAGLPDPTRLPVMMVQHKDGNSIHVHILSLRADALTLKSYQPFVKQRGDVQRFNDWNKLMQLEHGLENPNSLDHKHGVSINPRDPNKKTKEQLNEYITKLVNNGDITNRDDVIRTLNAIDIVKVSRKTSNSISVKIDGRKQAIRLSGDLYAKTFTSPKVIREQSRGVDKEDIQQLRETLQERVQQVSSSYRETFKNDAVHNFGSSNLEPNLSSNNRNPNHKSKPRIDKKVSTEEVKDKLKRQKIFNGAEFTDNGIFWKGDYGSAQISYNDDGGLTLSKGSTMEWRMAAQYALQSGWSGANIETDSIAAAERAFKEYNKVGIDNISITIGGEDVTAEIKDRLVQKQAERKNATQAVRAGTEGTRPGRDSLRKTITGRIEQTTNDGETVGRDNHSIQTGDNIVEQFRDRLEEVVGDKIKTKERAEMQAKQLMQVKQAEVKRRFIASVKQSDSIAKWYLDNGIGDSETLSQYRKKMLEFMGIEQPNEKQAELMEDSVKKDLIKIDEIRKAPEFKEQERMRDIQKRVDAAGGDLKAVLDGKISQEELVLLNEHNGVNEHMQRGSHAPVQRQQQSLGMSM